MQEKELVKKLQELKQIKPSKDWVVSLKREIMGEQPRFGTQILSVFTAVPRTVSHHKVAYATATAFMILIAMVGVLFVIPSSNNNNLETQLLAAAVQSRYTLEVANEKLENLTQIAMNNQADDITSAVKEANDSIAKASETITEEIVGNPKALKEIVSAVKQIDASKKNLQTLGVIVDEDYQLNNVLAPLVQREMESLENSTLNESQQRELRELKGLYDQGQYSQALEKILSINNIN